MTGYSDDSSTKKSNSDEEEQKRLQVVLKNAEQTWKRGLGQLNDDESLLVGGKRKRDTEDPDVQDQEGMLSLLSPELREQFAGMESLAILPAGSKKKNKKKEPPPLTPAEIKAAKALYKNTQRKLSQLEQRKKQKELRSGLYKELKENTLLAPAAIEGDAADAEKNSNASVMFNNKITPEEAQSLLLKSSELGKKLSKKQKLKQIRQREALGLKLTKDEMDLLYVKYQAPEDISFPIELYDTKIGCEVKKEDMTVTCGKKKKSKKKKKRSPGATNIEESEPPVETTPKKAKTAIGDQTQSEVAVTNIEEGGSNAWAPSTSDTTAVNNASSTATPSSSSYAQIMLAGLSSLKTKTDTQNVNLAREKALQQQQAEEEALRLEREERKRRKIYSPSETVKVSTMHRLLVAPANDSSRYTKKIISVDRPTGVEESRYDLPVSAMEFEIIDAVRSNDCTILCGETGSGKSTQGE